MGPKVYLTATLRQDKSSISQFFLFKRTPQPLIRPPHAYSYNNIFVANRVIRLIGLHCNVELMHLIKLLYLMFPQNNALATYFEVLRFKVDTECVVLS